MQCLKLEKIQRQNAPLKPGGGGGGGTQVQRWAHTLVIKIKKYP